MSAIVNLARMLPERLMLTAYYAGDEAAWSKEDSLIVVDILSAERLAIKGIEVWLPTEPGPTIPEPFLYVWQAEARRSREEWSAYVERANRLAAEYVRSFQWDPKDKTHHGFEPYFNIGPVESDHPR